MLAKRRLVLQCLSFIGLCYFFAWFFIGFQFMTDMIDAERQLLDQLQRNENLLGILREKQADLKKRSTVPITLPVLVMACNRPENLDRTLSQVIRLTNATQHALHVNLPVLVSQDCHDVKISDLITKYYQYNITHIQQPDLTDLNIGLATAQRRFVGYYNIARHYKWALSQVFGHLNHSAVIIIEDDLDLSADFFEYFVATLPILQADPTLWCVSSWNDNGKFDRISNEPELLYRTDFFPGLGWMMLQRTWFELAPTWPSVFWDDWMRHPLQRRSRACIRPEIPRSSTFGRLGISNGQYFDNHLKFITHYKGAVKFTQLNMSYLMQGAYNEMFLGLVYSKPLVDVNEIIGGKPKPIFEAVRLEYSDINSFRDLATKLGLMSDCKAGVPRMAYNGIVSLFLEGRRIFLAPPRSWSGYDESWT